MPPHKEGTWRRKERETHTWPHPAAKTPAFSITFALDLDWYWNWDLKYGLCLGSGGLGRGIGHDGPLIERCFGRRSKGSRVAFGRLMMMMMMMI